MTDRISNGQIVVGVDGSSDSGVALDWAAAEAHARAAGLLIVYGLHVPLTVGPYGTPSIMPAMEDLRRYGEDVLADATRRVAGQAPGVEVETWLAAHPPAEALLQASRDGASLVVVGTRGLGTAAAIAMGSVSNQVATHAACPTIVIPEPEQAPPDDGSIVVGVDGSEHGSAALRFALREASLRSAKVVAVHAYRAPAPPFTFFNPAGTDAAAEAERQHAQSLVRAEASVDQAVATAASETGVEADVTVRITEGRPADVLIDQSRDAALTVVGTRGHGELRAVVLGSVSHAVVSHARRPVAVVRADAA
ncbi:universal stress protein [Myceligenerans indicum]|uniref:Universal stress protein n=1 Tax=Myceligenerans indicum TaxID=2593663 RepID=A0ABS1LLE5_9MICO|nr:universal stress protein [Myceligenerans indicum]MBL0886954.1 universal stress protein [Myceligenerans indicum]